jgi:hypothetical protein
VRPRAGDAAPPEHSPVVIEDGDLARRYGAHGLVERDRDPSGDTALFDPRGRLHLAMPDPNAHAPWQVDTLAERDVDHVRVCGGEGPGVAEVHGGRRRVDPCHEGGLADRDAESLPLAEGEAVHAGVRADDAAFGVEDRSGPNSPVRPRLDERCIGGARASYEAELLALAFGGPGQPTCEGLGADFGLLRAAHGKHEPLELLAAGGIEEVALVLGAVAPLGEERAVLSVTDDARVVARRDRARPEPVGELEEDRELDVAVARRARARGLARQVGIDEGVDDRLPEELSPVERVVSEAQHVGRASRVVLILGRAASTVAGRRAVVAVVPEVQGDADHLVSRVDEARGGDGGVDSPTHGHDHAGGFHRVLGVLPLPPHC